MLKNISFGIYYPGNSLLHHLQARTKLLLMVWMAIFLTLANRHFWHFVPYIVIAVLVLVGTTLSGVSLREMWRRMRILVILALIGAIPTIFTHDSDSIALHTFGPLLAPFALLQWAVIIYGVLLTLYVIALILPLPAFAGFRQSRAFKRLRGPLILLTLVALITFLFIRTIPGTRTFPIGPLSITDTGVWLLMSLSVFIALYAFSILLTMTTSPIALIEGLTKLMLPLRWVRLPVDDFALMTLISLRFIPTLFEEVDQLLKAQMSRGADYANGTIRERIQSLLALFVPLIQGVLRRASDLSIALEARGYESEGRQTYLHEGSLRGIDYAAIAVIVVITVPALLL
ncbi:MAG TPA: energy-coupling factor transporter transmembrane component T [Ktedonobacteraceae bacterium]|nr:energy-coupling factor transporter transmembrane component T [Ktedonobacteraceae bacterium]